MTFHHRPNTRNTNIEIRAYTGTDLRNNIRRNTNNILREKERKDSHTGWGLGVGTGTGTGTGNRGRATTGGRTHPTRAESIQYHNQNSVPRQDERWGNPHCIPHTVALQPCDPLGTAATSSPMASQSCPGRQHSSPAALSTRPERARECSSLCVWHAQRYWKWRGASGTGHSSSRGDCCLGRLDSRDDFVIYVHPHNQQRSQDLKVSWNSPVMLLNWQHARPRGQVSLHGRGREQHGWAG